jgi:hypothetical protein
VKIKLTKIINLFSNNLNKRRFQMKARKTFLTLTIAGLITLLFCLPASVFAGPGPNSGTGPDNILENRKVSGPNPVAFLLAGWRPTDTVGQGILEAFLWVEGQLFKGIMAYPHGEAAMQNASASTIIVLDDNPSDVNFWVFPEEIATELYGKPEHTLVVVLEPKDVSDFDVQGPHPKPNNPIELDVNNPPLGPWADFGYKYLLFGEVRLTFLVPTKDFVTTP